MIIAVGLTSVVAHSPNKGKMSLLQDNENYHLFSKYFLKAIDEHQNVRLRENYGNEQMFINYVRNANMTTEYYNRHIGIYIFCSNCDTQWHRYVNAECNINQISVHPNFDSVSQHCCL